MLTTDMEFNGDAVIDLYQGPAGAEHAFLELKSPMKTRPVHHWKEGRARAQLFLCVLSYGLTWWIDLEGRSKGWEVTVEYALDRLREIQMDQVGVPGIVARRWAMKELAGEEQLVVESLGMSQEVVICREVWLRHKIGGA
jgi:transposase